MTGGSFINRESELELLKTRYDRDQADLIVIYGRRRLGKSELVRQSIKDRSNAIYWQATEETAPAQLDHFVETASESFPELARTERDWESQLRRFGDEESVVILDEFPYLIEANDAIPSKIQRVWDLHLQETGMTLVLVGSAISIMEETVLGGESPLYGRRSATIDLDPLSIDDAATFYGEADPASSVEYWSVFGGTPYYLQTIDSDASFGENVQRHVLSEHGLLHNEPEFLLRTEFGIRKPNTYFTILRALATGKRTSKEIGDVAGMATNELSTYLTKLRRLRLIERDHPVTTSPTSTRNHRYRLRDPFFRFWFRYVYGQTEPLSTLGDRAYADHVAPTLSTHVGPVFERLCQAKLSDLYEYTFKRVGYWWHNHHEIDVLGLTTEGTMVAGECKFTNRPVTEGDLVSLERTAEEIQWTPPGGGDPSIEYCLFAKSGFDERLTEIAADRKDCSLFTVERLLRPNSH